MRTLIIVAKDCGSIFGLNTFENTMETKRTISNIIEYLNCVKGIFSSQVDQVEIVFDNFHHAQRHFLNFVTISLSCYFFVEATIRYRV